MVSLSDACHLDPFLQLTPFSGRKVILDRKVLRIIHENVTIDWTVKDRVHVNLKWSVKHILHKYGYPPDIHEVEIQTVLQQTELTARE